MRKQSLDLQSSLVIFNYYEDLGLAIQRLLYLFIHLFIYSIFYEPFNFVTLVNLFLEATKSPLHVYNSQIGSDTESTQSAGAVEYADCISTDGLDLNITPNYIRSWGSSFGLLGNVEYSFIAINLQST